MGFTRSVTILISFLLSNLTSAQQVGLVLSGGGANGLAHIGVLKALEENNIPIDYITGTSIGAFVGALYASGYTPGEIEALFNSSAFQDQASGTIDNKYTYYFKQSRPNASWISIRFSPKSILETSLPTHLINPEPIDLGLMQLLAGPGAAAGYDFNRLMIPFRCVAADIVAKKDYVFSEGSLNRAVRASIAYPFYLKPVSAGNSLLMDGGLYNNFPSDVMYRDFFPDIIIGSNVAGQVSLPEEDNLLSQIRGILVTLTNYDTQCDNGIMIEPVLDIGLFEFDNPGKAIEEGYRKTIEQMDEILLKVSRRLNSEELKDKRQRFRSSIPELKIGEIEIQGLGRKQAEYARNIVTDRREVLGFEEFRSRFFKLYSDNRIKSIFPDAVYDPSTNTYKAILDIRQDRELTAEFGGNISSKPINQGFFGLQYNRFGKTALGLTANTYFGRLYTSGHLSGRLDFASPFPFFLQGSGTLNEWDYYRSTDLFLTDEKPSYLVQKDRYVNLAVGMPVGIKGTLSLEYQYAQLRNDYYQTRIFSVSDTSDRTDFNLLSGNLRYERNSMNRKQYASEGSRLGISIRYVQGEEYNIPGSTADNQYPFRHIHEWYQGHVSFDNYFLRHSVFKFGVYAELAYTTQPVFNNYISSVLSAPAFMPVPESTTLFLENFRAYKFGALGGKMIVSMFDEALDLRLEAYVFQPYRSINKTNDQRAELGEPFLEQYYLGSSALVYHSPLGPVALNLNYYQDLQYPVSFLFHFGYIIFNRRALD